MICAVLAQSSCSDSANEEVRTGRVAADQTAEESLPADVKFLASPGAVRLRPPGSDASVIALIGREDILEFHAWSKVGSFHSGYDLSDESLEALAQLPNLEVIEIWNPGYITDEGLKAFYGHPNLRQVRIYYDLQTPCEVTEEGVREFEDNMPPHCSIDTGPRA